MRWVVIIGLLIAFLAPHALANARVGEQITVGDPVATADGLIVPVILDGEPLALRLRELSVRTSDMFVRVVGHLSCEMTNLSVVAETDRYTDYSPGNVRTHCGDIVNSQSGRRRGSVIASLGSLGSLFARLDFDDFGSDDDIWIRPQLSDGKTDHYIVRRSANRTLLFECDAEVASSRRDAGRVSQQTDRDVTDLYCANLGIDMDFEYFSHFATVEDALAWVELLVAIANTQFEYQVQIRHRLPLVMIHADPDDGHDEFLETSVFFEWTSDHDAVDWDMVHILTGRDLAGLGGATIGSVCRSSGSPFSRSEFTDDIALASHLIEHELAHNWDAVHCECGRGTMVATTLSPHRLQFTQESIDQIIAYRDTRPCLEICEQINIIRRDVPFEDDFEDDSLDPEIWAQQNGVSLEQDGNDQFVSIARDGVLSSVSFDTLTLFAVDLEYEWLAEAGATGTLLVDFLDRSYRWQTVTTHPASDSGGVWQAESVRLYGDARVFNSTADSRDFQLRLTASGGSFALDDVRIIPYQFNPCPEDCEPNEVVNVDDLFFVVFQAGNPEADPGCDVTPQFPNGSFGDGDVDIDDILAVISAFGPCDPR